MTTRERRRSTSLSEVSRVDWEEGGPRIRRGTRRVNTDGKDSRIGSRAENGARRKGIEEGVEPGRIMGGLV